MGRAFLAPGGRVLRIKQSSSTIYLPITQQVGFPRVRLSMQARKHKRLILGAKGNRRTALPPASSLFFAFP